MRTFAQKKAGQQNTSAKSTMPGQAHFGQSREVNSILTLPRMLGNQAVSRLLEANTGYVKGDSTPTESARFGNDFSRIAVHAVTPTAVQPRVTTGTPGDYYEQATEVSQHQLPAPRIKISGFSPSNALKAWPQNQTWDKTESDKSVTPSTEDQDQSASLSSLVPTANGVVITVEPEGAYSSTEFPEGFRWTQTVTTNANKGGPLLATPVTYTDPTPNDDVKPFYWTDAEELQHKGTFIDAPSRNPRPAGTVVWDAILSLNGVNGKTVTRFDSLGYGFSVDSGGNVSLHGAVTPGNVSDHQSKLSSDFPAWTFK